LFRSKEPALDLGNMDLSLFGRATFDGSGNLMFFENSNVYSPVISLAQGDYNLKISGKSLPEKPLNGENAHFKVRIGNNEIGQFYMNTNEKIENVVPFKVDAPIKGRIFITYDNDALIDGVDRNAMITKISLQKK